MINLLNLIHVKMKGLYNEDYNSCHSIQVSYASLLHNLSGCFLKQQGVHELESLKGYFLNFLFKYQ